MPLDLETASANCDAARDALLEGVTALQAEGPALQKALEANALKILADPEQGADIHERAEQMQRELRRFGSAQTIAMERLALRTVGARQRVDGAAVHQIADIMNRIGAGGGPPAVSPPVAFERVALAEVMALTLIYTRVAEVVALHHHAIRVFADVHAAAVREAIKRGNEEAVDDVIDQIIELVEIANEEAATVFELVLVLRDLAKYIAEMRSPDIADPKERLVDVVDRLTTLNTRLEALAATL